MEQHLLFEVRADRLRQHHHFEILALAREVGDGVAMRHRRGRLRDYRARVEFLGHVVCGRSDQFHAPVMRLLVRPLACKRRQEAVMDIDDRPVPLPLKVPRQDLHVAREYDRVCVEFAEPLKECSFSLGFPVLQNRNHRERYFERARE